MGRLHELLAIEDDRKKVYIVTLKEAQKAFDTSSLFAGMKRELEKIDDRCPDVPDEHVEMTTTVHDKLTYVFEKATDYIDVVLQKELTNQEARADLIVNDEVLATGLPATFLLGLETKLSMIRELLIKIPTLPAGVECKSYPEMGDHVYQRVHPEINMKTVKTVNHKVLVPPTDKHPAQIEKWNEDIVVGKFRRYWWYGFMSSKEKADTLSRIDTLYQAVKQARQRANNIDASSETVGWKLFEFILEG